MWQFKFRIRSKERDLKSDEIRCESIRLAVRSAIASAEYELKGLLSRIEDATAKAAFTYDNADSDYLTRSPADETAISDAEQSLVGALKRKEHLSRHLSLLKEIDVLVLEKLRSSI